MADLLKVRESFHHFIDPMWQSGLVSRDELYKEMSGVLGKEAHVSQMSLKEIQDCAEHFIQRDYWKFPCMQCQHFVTLRHFVPVCEENVERNCESCGKFIKKNF